MRIAVITFFCSLFIIFATMVVGIGVVVSGPLNAQEFFIEGVQSEFDDWSQRLIKIDGEVYYNDKRSCPDELRQFMARFGILSVRVSQAESRVDWLLDGNFRVRVHYICSLNDGERRQDGGGSWIFKLENESISPESLLSILNARRDSCKTWIAALCISLCVMVGFYRIKVFHHIRQMMSEFVWVVMMYIVWSIDIFVGCLAGMSLCILVMEWTKQW